MKKLIVVFLVSTLTVTATFGQMLVRNDGGVKIGTPPKSSASAAPSWRLPSKGFEVVAGEIRFNLPNYNFLKITGRSNEYPFNSNRIIIGGGTPG